MLLLKSFFAGLFLFNSLPHLFKGITGQTHMTPFKRVSSAYLNLFWAFINIIMASLLLVRPLTGVAMWVFLAGGFLISMADAQLFSKPNARLPWHKD